MTLTENAQDLVKIIRKCDTLSFLLAEILPPEALGS